MLSTSNQSLNNYSDISQKQINTIRILTKFLLKTLTIYNSNILEHPTLPYFTRELSITLESLTDKLKSLRSKQNLLLELKDDASIPEKRMDEYYVKLQIILDTKKAGIEKLPIELEKIFNPVGGQSDVEKVIIVEIDEADKTTLLCYFLIMRLNKWSYPRIYNKMFDYIFKIKLKNLSNNIAFIKYLWMLCYEQ